MEASLKEKKEHVRENKWSQSIAVGSKKFIEKVKSQLGIRASPYFSRARAVQEQGISARRRSTLLRGLDRDSKSIPRSLPRG